MTFKDYYITLGIVATATPEDIKHAYRRLAQKYHPDVNQSSDAEELFKEICAAYDVLKDPEKRAVYDAKREMLLPKKMNWLQLGLHWIHTKKSELQQNIALFYAKNKAGNQANAFRAKNYRGVNTRTHYQSTTDTINFFSDFYSNYKLFIGLFFVIIIGIAIVIFLTSFIQEFRLHAQQQQITEAILNNETSAIVELEQTDSAQLFALLQDETLKTTLLQFYLQQIGEKTIEKLSQLDEKMQVSVFHDSLSENLLVDYYLKQIQLAVDQDDFIHASKLLKTAQHYYPTTDQFIDKQAEIEFQREQQLVSLTKHYVNCLQVAIQPDDCFTTQSHFDLQLLALYDVDLVNQVYTENVEYALARQDNSTAAQLMSDWEQILPKSIKQRDDLKTFLTPERVKVSTINQEIIFFITQFKQQPTAWLQQIKTIKIPTSLIELLTTQPHHFERVADVSSMIAEKLPPTQENPKTEEIITTEDLVTNQTTDEINTLLTTCQSHLDANRLTTGKPGTAVECYRSVLAKDGHNVTAQVGLQKIEQTYRTWLETALFKNNVEDAKTYLDRLRTVNAHAANLDQLQQRVEQLIKQSTEHKSVSEPVIVPALPTDQQQSTLVEKEPKPNACEKCNCADLYRQLSIGLKPLTTEERAFLDDCYHIF